MVCAVRGALRITNHELRASDYDKVLLRAVIWIVSGCAIVMSSQSQRAKPKGFAMWHYTKLTESFRSSSKWDNNRFVSLRTVRLSLFSLSPFTLECCRHFIVRRPGTCTTKLVIPLKHLEFSGKKEASYRMKGTMEKKRFSMLSPAKSGISTSMVVAYSSNSERGLRK